MTHKRLKVFAFLLIGLGISGLQAQEAVSASGGDASGTGGSAAYTIGQVAYIFNVGTNGTAEQGVQHAYEIFSFGVAEADNQFNLGVFPNPATDILMLVVENYKQEDLSYRLYDIRGKLLENRKIEGNETSIMMSGYTPAIYFLKVFNNNQEVEIFKIIKN